MSIAHREEKSVHPNSMYGTETQPTGFASEISGTVENLSFYTTFWMIGTYRTKRRLAVVLPIVIASMIVWHYFFYSSRNVIDEPIIDEPIIDEPIIDEPIIDFFKPVLEHHLKAPSLRGKYKVGQAKEILSHETYTFTKEYLESCIDVPQETKNLLTEKHRRYVAFLLSDKNNVDTYGFYRKGTTEWKQYHNKNGVVYIGGGKYTWLSYLSIRQLRKTGSELPIEVFFPPHEEYDEYYCENILPKYNAKCIVCDKLLEQALELIRGGYQYKMLAILMSSFENTLYLDSDVMPLVNFDHLFTSDLYKKNGLMLWPDAWARTTSPKYYEIAGIDVPEVKVRYSESELKALALDEPVLPLEEGTFANSNFHDFRNTIPDFTVEAGMMLINKSSHVRTMQLALYYNVLGPDFYYPLLTQGSAGEGDKETFNAAATVLGESYYVCPKKFNFKGYFHVENSAYVSKSLAVHDPIHYEANPNEEKFLFLHCSYPKLLPDWLLGELTYPNGEQIRMYSGVYSNVGYDVDLQFFELFTEGFCNGYRAEGDNSDNANEMWIGHFLPFVKYHEHQDKCDKLYLPHLRWLRETTTYGDKGPLESSSTH